MIRARALGGWLADLVFPKRCGGCKKALAPGSALEACLSCVASLPLIGEPVCTSCGAPFAGVAATEALAADGRECVDCRGHRHGWTLARSFFAYDGAVRGMVTELKYSGRRRMARTMAVLALKDDSPARLALSGAEIAVAVPLHPSRQSMRGYNQSEELARELARLAGIPFLCGVVARTRDTRPQVGLKRDERRGNVRDAFTVVRPEAVAGREVALVDDVMTTGATLAECSRALMQAGSVAIRAIAFARDL